MNNLNDYTAYNKAKEDFLAEVHTLLQTKYPVTVKANIPYGRVCSILDEYDLNAEVIGIDYYYIY